MSEFTTRIRSIKLDDGKIEIHAVQTHQASDDEREITLRSEQEPRPELVAALAPDVRRLIDVPHDWVRDGLAVKKVVWSYSENTGVQGATICCQAKLECADAPLVFNTPHLPYEQYSEGGNAPTMPGATRERLDDLEAEALKFLDGVRAQGDLFDERAA
jgi:hypothetical protein